MLGRLFFGVLLTGVFVAAGTGAWLMGWLPVNAQDQLSSDQATSSGLQHSSGKPGRAGSLGGALYAQVAAAPARQQARAVEPRESSNDPIIIPNARLVITSKQDVPSQRDGVLWCLGIELKPGEKPQEEVYEVQMGDNTTKRFRRLKEGDQIVKNQLIGIVDLTLARADFDIKEAKLHAAVADKDAADKTRDEAQERYSTQIKLLNSGRGATSMEDVRGAKLAWDRYVSEAVSKKEAIQVAQQELNQAKKTLTMHEIHAVIPGKVKTLYKHVGEAVKSLEPVVQIQNYDLLRAEGTVEVQYARALREGADVLIEPILRENAARTFSGHRLEITGVAISKDLQNPLIVSASEDGTVMVWKRNSLQPVRILRHPTAVEAVACTPPGAGANLCLTGGADGYGRLWELDGNSDKPIQELRAHRGPIHCVAFSPDGTTCATGGEDNEIMVWDTANGSLRYKIPGHRAFVTSLSFTADAQLVSVSRDDTVRVWKLEKEGYEPVSEIKRRSHDVGQLGVSPNGQLIFDEQGLEMRVLSLKDQMTDAILHSASQSSKFRTLALFSPDSKLALTTSGSEGIFQLWRIDKLRSSELRQLIPGLHSEATCAAFSPDGSFVVGGVKDRKIYLWDLPTDEEISQRIVARITNIERTTEDVENKVRIMAEFANPPGTRRLNAGDIVTVVAYPSK